MSKQESPPDPFQLIVVISVDQMRYDYLTRFASLLDEHGGFADFIEKGISYQRALYRHAGTFTAPGHATIMSGAHPRTHGIIANEWFDRHTPIGAKAPAGFVEVVESKFDPHRFSPRNLEAPTLGDYMKQETDEEKRPRVVSVAGKDRSAILMGGHLADAAYWYDKDKKRYRSSTYYREQLVGDVNQKKLPFNGEGELTIEEIVRWILEVRGCWDKVDWVSDDDFESFARPDDFKYETNLLGDRRFAHTLSAKHLDKTPYSDVLTLEAVKRAVDVHGLGKREGVTDLLTISFSALDLAGHLFGPWSQECMDVFLRLDRLLHELKTFLVEHQELGRVLYVVTADHGVLPLPEFLSRTETGSVRRMREPLFESIRQRLNQRLRGADRLMRRAGEEDDEYLVAGGVYLDLDEVRARGMTRADAEEFVADTILRDPLFDRVYTRSQLLGGSGRGDQFHRLFLNSYRDFRSPDIMILPREGRLVTKHETGTSHGTAHEYDRHVPLMLWWPGRQDALKTAREVGPEDLAPTLAEIAGVEDFPREPDSVPLVEVLEAMGLRNAS